MRGFLAELRRRHIYRFGLIYLAVAWLLVQVTVTVQEPLRLPGWVDTFVIVVLALGFPVTLLSAWALETKPAGSDRADAAVETGRARLDAGATSSRGDVQFCLTPSGHRLAYTRSGSGPPLLRTGNWLSHQELERNDFVWGPYRRDLSREFEIVAYDGRGTGLSDRDVESFSLDTMIEDMEVVADANRLERFAILSYSQSCSVSIAYAVRHPERVTRMVFYGGFIHTFLTPEEIEAFATLFARNWGQDNASTRQMFTSSFFPDSTKAEFDAFNELQRHSASPSTAARLFRACHAIDVRNEATQVSCPTLVMHSRDEPGVPVEHGREIAALIPGARFVTLNSRNHLVLESEPEYRRVVDEMAAFIRG